MLCLVAFNFGTGALTAGLMFFPGLNAVALGFAVGGVAFIGSVGNDLFDSGGDWSQVNWGKAVTIGVLVGATAGFGRYAAKMLNGLKILLKSLL